MLATFLALLAQPLGTVADALPPVAIQASDPVPVLAGVDTVLADLAPALRVATSRKDRRHLALRRRSARRTFAGLPGTAPMARSPRGAPPARPAPAPFRSIGGEDHVVTLWRAEDGLFYITARINGEPVRLIVDTGATYTVLSADDARRVGVDPQRITFGERADTAAGASPMARIVLTNLELGRNVAAGVPAMVASGPLATSLLGQNVLSRLGSVTIEGDRMTLR